jgi:hypothetical protein
VRSHHKRSLRLSHLATGTALLRRLRAAARKQTRRRTRLLAYRIHLPLFGWVTVRPPSASWDQWSISSIRPTQYPIRSPARKTSISSRTHYRSRRDARGLLQLQATRESSSADPSTRNRHRLYRLIELEESLIMERQPCESRIATR